MANNADQDDSEEMWGVPASQAIAELEAGKITKWDRETTKWRLEDHCLALANEGNSRADVLKYLIEYNRAGSDTPNWFEKHLPALVAMHEPTFQQHDHERNLAQANSPGFELVRFTDVEPEAIQWIWEGYLAERKLTMFNGEPGHGKSMASLDIAARITTGKSFPDGQQNGHRSSVIILTEEEDAADTILPRFIAAGGDRSKFLQVRVKGGDSVFKIEDHLHLLENRIEAMEENVKLIIFDPLIDFCRAKQNVDEEVRPVLTTLRKWAEKHNLAILGINHLNKKTDMSAIHRVSGARAWLSVARLNFLVGKSESGTRHICAIKMNLSPDGEGSLDFEINNTKLPGPGIGIGMQPVITWHGKGSTTPEDILAPKTPAQVNAVVAWLESALQPAGTWQLKEVILEAAAAKEFSTDQVKRAFQKLEGSVEHRRTNSVPAKSEWRLVKPGLKVAIDSTVG